MTDNERCRWCTAPSGKTELDFSVIDDELGQYVPVWMINFCPFCGRELKGNDR